MLTRINTPPIYQYGGFPKQSYIPLQMALNGTPSISKLGVINPGFIVSHVSWAKSPASALYITPRDAAAFSKPPLQFLGGYQAESNRSKYQLIWFGNVWYSLGLCAPVWFSTV